MALAPVRGEGRYRKAYRIKNITNLSVSLSDTFPLLTKECLMTGISSSLLEEIKNRLLAIVVYRTTLLDEQIFFGEFLL